MDFDVSKLRRRADGKPETRSLDDLLAETAQDDVVQRLPGKGRPLDRHGYRHADPETRMANKLLADHDVIPPQLQDRRPRCWVCLPSNTAELVATLVFCRLSPPPRLRHCQAEKKTRNAVPASTCSRSAGESPICSRITARCWP